MPSLLIERDVLIEAPVEVVWRTITEPDQMSQWFADRVELVVEPGAHGYMGFGDQGGPVVVETVDPPTRFSFRWNHPAGEEPVAGNSMLVEFTLTPEGDERTRLRVVESGHELLDWPDAEKQRYAEEHQGGWGEFLDRLATLLAKRQPEMTAQADDELWSAIADPSRRRVLDLLVGNGEASASWLAGTGPVLPPGRLQAPGRARTGRADQPPQTGPGGSLPGRGGPPRPGHPGHGRARRAMGPATRHDQAARRGRARRGERKPER